MSRPFLKTSKSLYIFNKSEMLTDLLDYNYLKSVSAFEYINLPDEIDPFILEFYLQSRGHSFFTRVNDMYYIVSGSFADNPNGYYIPENYNISNPYLDLSKTTYTNKKDGVIIYNDFLYKGLNQLNRKYSTMILENEISMRIVSILSRMRDIISATDDVTKQSAEEYLKKIVEGSIGIIADDGLLNEKTLYRDSLSGDTNSIKDLIEYEQYLKASWANELGLNANYNMKRESLSNAETALNDDILFPLIDGMLASRKKWVKDVNELYNLNIKVDLGSVWKTNKNELQFAESQKKGVSYEVTGDTEPKDISKDGNNHLNRNTME